MNPYMTLQIVVEKELEIRRNANNPHLDAIKDARLFAPKPARKNFLSALSWLPLFRKAQQQPCETC
jgi:hypothetical protein